MVLVSVAGCLLFGFVIRLLALVCCGYGACFGFVTLVARFFGLDVIFGWFVA